MSPDRLRWHPEPRHDPWPSGRALVASPVDAGLANPAPEPLRGRMGPLVKADRKGMRSEDPGRLLATTHREPGGHGGRQTYAAPACKDVLQAGSDDAGWA